MNITPYLAKQYEFPPCWLLVADVYQHELGLPVLEFKTIDNSVRAIASAFRLALHKGAHGFTRIDAPRDFCVVLMGRSGATGVHHCGVYYDRKILHAVEGATHYQDVASLTDTYGVMEFWAR